MHRSDEYMPTSKHEALEEVRELSQIAFGSAGLVGEAAKAVEGVSYGLAKSKENKQFFQDLKEAVDSRGKKGSHPDFPNIETRSLDIGDGMTATSVEGNLIITKGNDLLYDQSSRTSKFDGISEDYWDKIPRQEKKHILHRVEHKAKQKDVEGKTQPKYSRNPREIARKLADLNKVNGQRLTDGSYVYKGKNFEIKSKGDRNVSLTRKGEEKPAFEISKGRVKANDLSKAEVASVHRNHERHIERQDPGDRGA